MEKRKEASVKNTFSYPGKRFDNANGIWTEEENGVLEHPAEPTALVVPVEASGSSAVGFGGRRLHAAPV